MKTKICKRCAEEKPLTAEYFYRRTASKSGFGYNCKVCKKQHRTHHRGRDAKDLRKRPPNKDRSKQKQYMRLWRAEQPAGMYKITNTESEKIYIGVTSQIRQRWSNHKSHLKKRIHRNAAMQEDYDNHGVNSFKFEILQEYSPNTQRLTLERVEQEEVQKRLSEGQNLYNVGSPGTWQRINNGKFKKKTRKKE